MSENTLKSNEIDYSQYGEDFIELESDNELEKMGIENDQWWSPKEINQTIAGNVKEIITGQYGEQILLDLYSENEDLNGYEIELPAHKDLQNKTKSVEVGDFIVVSLIKIIPSNNPDYNDKKVYKVVKVPSRQVEYETVED
jgi:hypothetical protein